MKTQMTKTQLPLHPPAYPNGWFFICYSHELGDDELFSKTFMGSDVVAFRDDKGEVAVLDAICPHLGAHMGVGGTVKAGSVECPFHQFRFDGKGSCNYVPGAPPPKNAKVKSWPVQEVDGVIMAYHDAEGLEPSWRIPELELEGWSELATHHFHIKGHPQETTENCVDAAHLITIHGYDSVSAVEAPVLDGPHMHGAYTMTRDSRFGPLGKIGFKLDVDFEVDVWGLGHSTVQINLPKYGLRVRLLTLSTPVDGEYIDLHIALRVKSLENPDSLLPGLSKVPPEWIRKVVLELGKRAYMHDIQQDFHIWENKRYLGRPALSRADGPVMPFRRYCQQFYPQGGGDSATVDLAS